jgi:hypothetical protein
MSKRMTPAEWAERYSPLAVPADLRESRPVFLVAQRLTPLSSAMVRVEAPTALGKSESIIRWQ